MTIETGLSGMAIVGVALILGVMPGSAMAPLSKDIP